MPSSRSASPRARRSPWTSPAAAVSSIPASGTRPPSPGTWPTAWSVLPRRSGTTGRRPRAVDLRLAHLPQATGRVGVLGRGRRPDPPAVDEVAALLIRDLWRIHQPDQDDGAPFGSAR